MNLSIEESEHSNSEVLSGLRQRLRAIPDVQIVYTRNDADLVVILIAMENRLTSDRKVGYEMAVTFTVPCKEWIGSNVNQAFPFTRYDGSAFYTGANIAEVIEPAVADIDAKYIEISVSRTRCGRNIFQKLRNKCSAVYQKLRGIPA